MLLSRDYPMRVQFCQKMLQKHKEDSEFLGNILWTDESTFKKDGFMNMHNLHSCELAHSVQEDDLFNIIERV